MFVTSDTAPRTLLVGLVLNVNFAVTRLDARLCVDYC